MTDVFAPSPRPAHRLIPSQFPPIGLFDTVATAADLATALGTTKPLWDGLIAEMADRHGVAIQEWSSYSVKAGWALRLKRAKRTILWMSPCESSFRVSFILGERAFLAARKSALSALYFPAVAPASAVVWGRTPLP